MRPRNIIIAAVAIFAILAAIGSTVKTPAPASSASDTTTPTDTATATTDLSGQVVFGKKVDASAMSVAAPITTAKTTDKIGWVAYFSDSANSTSLTLTLAKVGAGGAESPVTTQTVDVSNPASNELAHVPDDAIGAAGAGTFTLRYIRPSDSKVLAEGTITLK